MKLSPKAMFKIICAERDLKIQDAVPQIGYSREHIHRVLKGIHPAGPGVRRAIEKWSDGRIRFDQ